jgi:hypothetical protein
VSDIELAILVQELFELDTASLLSFAKINYQGYHNTSNVTEDRAPEP